MDTDEIRNLFNSRVELHRAKLKDYVRDYSKIAHSWGSDDEDAGVLGIQRVRGEWCNGIVVDRINKTGIENYYVRELGVKPEKYEDRNFGYDIIEIDADRFEFYGSRPNINTPTITAVTNNRLTEPNPHKEYVKLCENAAKEYGEKFYEDFMQSTHEFYDNL